MNESQRRAWAALNLGPLWLRRDGGPAPEPAVPVTQEASAAVPQRADGPVDLAQGPEPDMAPSTGRPGTAPVDDRSAIAPAAVERNADTALSDGQSDTVPAMPDAPGEAVRPIDALDWDELASRVAGCRACTLCRTRTQTVFGVGPREARWMIIGEAPGADEDAQGEPFVGQAGRLLDNMLASLGLSRERNVFIANVLKCRPPGNRNPAPVEVASCSPYLKRQIELVDPTLIVLMGRFAATTVLGVDSSVGKLRNQLHRIDVGSRQVPAIVTYHPAYLLRDLPEKAKAWRDLQFARREFARASSTG